MSELDGHTIHRGHIHHGWNNAFPPCLRIAPGQTGQFDGLHPHVRTAPRRPLPGNLDGDA